MTVEKTRTTWKMTMKIKIKNEQERKHAKILLHIVPDMVKRGKAKERGKRVRDISFRN